MKNCLGTSTIQQLTEEPRGRFRQASAEFLPLILLQYPVLQAWPWTWLYQTAFCRNAQGLTERLKLFGTNRASLAATESLAANCVMLTWVSFLPWKTLILLNATALGHLLAAPAPSSRLTLAKWYARFRVFVFFPVNIIFFFLSFANYSRISPLKTRWYCFPFKTLYF